MTIKQENRTIVTALKEQFDGEFIIIRTRYNSSIDKTEVSWASSISTKDTQRVLQGTYLMINSKEN